jgi:hypothetical protein
MRSILFVRCQRKWQCRAPQALLPAEVDLQVVRQAPSMARH